MPVILEEINPSWIDDGWGIQGEQDEYRFDDDLPWDITAWTRDQQTQDQQDFNCCGPPFDCTIPDLPTITLVYDGVEQCFPDPSTFPPAPFPNGTFTLGNTSPFTWAGRVRWCRNVDTNEWHTATGDECEEGEDQLDIDYEALCSGSTLTIADFGSNFFQAVGTPPILVNSRDCPDFIGGGGTATITIL